MCVCIYFIVRYLVEECSHIVDVVVDDEPNTLVCVVRGHFGQRVLLRFGHAGDEDGVN